MFENFTDATGLDLWLPLAAAAVIGFAVLMYVLKDWFDLGDGILFREGEDEWDITVRFAPGARSSLADLQRLVVVNEDGEQSQFLGSRTAWSLDGEAGGPLQFTWTMRGNPTTPIDANPIATTGLGTITAPNFRGAICSYGYNAQIHRLTTKNLSFSNGGQIEDNLDANAVSGSNGSNIVDRAPVVSVTVDRTHSAFPWRELQREGTPVRVAYMLGASPGNIVGIVAPKCQVEGVQRSDSNGIMTWDLQLNPLKVLEQGDDDFYLVQL